jgi:DNA-binding SARP family transcriptional activator
MASATLRIRLLGELDLRRDEVAVPPLGSARAESLLAYLLLPKPSRASGWPSLWPGSATPGPDSLRHLLHNLRRALPDPDRFLRVTQRTLRWRDDASGGWTSPPSDAVAGRAARAGGATLQEAVEGTAATCSRAATTVAAGGRERLRRRYLEALERLAELLEAGREHARAIGYAERLLREDPLREATYRLLMRLHDARGDRARALRTYHACAATLERELSVEPSAATRRAMAQRHPAPSRPPSRRRDGPVRSAGRPGRPGRPAGPPDRPVAGRRGRGRPAGAGHRRARRRKDAAGRGVQLLVRLPRGRDQPGPLLPGRGGARLRAGGGLAPLGRPGRASRTARPGPAGGAGPPAARAPPGRARPPRSRPAARPRPAPAPVRGTRRGRAGVPGPLLLVADDLHWAERETLQFLHYLPRPSRGPRSWWWRPSGPRSWTRSTRCTTC